MAWTPATVAFFTTIGLAIVGMTIWELVSPTRTRRGLLPMATTRGDRFFISLLSAAFVHLFWLGVVGMPLWPASFFALLLAVTLMRWG